MTRGLATGWMVGTTPTGLVAVGPAVEVDIVGDPDRAVALANGLARGSRDPASSAPDDDPAFREVAEHLRPLGAFDAPQPPPAGWPLAEALRADRAGHPPEGVVWTADEALILPSGQPPPERSRALRAFVAGLRPDGRRIAYAALADGRGTVHGDAPEADRVRRRIATIDGAGPAIAVVELADDGAHWTVPPGGVGAIGSGAAHRLGPIRWVSAPAPVTADAPDLMLCLAEVTEPRSAPGPDRVAQGTGTAGRAALVARAEGAERYAGHDASRALLRRASRSDLPGAVDPRDLFRRDPHQAGAPEDDGADGPRLWTPALDLDGTRRWVPAETVYLSLGDAAAPSALLPWSSSGLAAHGTAAAARERAVSELVERDAFVWTWIQRVSRERITAGLPATARARRRLLSRHGWETTWVNLTLDSHPVILCCLVHQHRGLILGAACAPDPGAALDRATVEALVLALRFPDDGAPPPTPADVRTPRDHLRLHRDPARRPDHAFLFTGADELDLGDIPTGQGEDLAARLAVLGHSPLVVDLTGPSTAPFSVVRALAPGLLPLTFGRGNDPSGLPRARRPVAARDGRRLGRLLAGEATAGRLPHPFP